MLINTLEVIHYPPPGSTWESLRQRNPTWAEIEEALIRLDRNVYPYLWLHISEPIEYDLPEHAINILGGLGEYAIHIEMPCRQLEYFDESREETIIEIWVSDQGAGTLEKNLCNDFNLLLKIVRHFAETGEPYPGVDWEG